jgi:hypothetical protein
MRAVPAKDTEERALQGIRLVADVGEDREPASRPQDAVDLVEGCSRPEPVEGLSAGDGVRRSGAARDGLGGAHDRLDAHRDQRLHRAHRLDGHDASPRVGEHL